MSAASQILKNFNIYVDGRSYAGNVDEITLPALNVTGEDYRAGGMDAPVELDMGMDKLEASFKVSKWDRNLIAKWGATNGGRVPLVFRGALEDLDGTVKAVEATLYGKIHGMETDTIAPGAKPSQTYRFAATRYIYKQDGETLHDIDVLNCKRIIDGVDRLAAIRTAIGI